MKDQLEAILSDIRRLRLAMFLSPEEVSGGLWLIEQKLNDAIVLGGDFLDMPLPQEAETTELIDGDDDLPF